MACHPYFELNVNTANFHHLQHFTIIFYDKTSDLQHVNEARQQLFVRKRRQWRDFPYSGCSTAAYKACSLSGWNMVHL